MFITTSQSGGTFKAAVRSSATHAVLYTATCTESEQSAARAVIRKNWSEAAARSVRELKDQDELNQYVGDFMRSPQRKQVFSLWTFNPYAR